MPNLETKIYVYIKLFMQAIMALGLAISIYKLEFVSAVIIGLIILVSMFPLFLRSRTSLMIPLEIEVMSIAIIFASLYLGEMSGFYEKFWWWDLLLHSTSGFLFGVFGFLLIWVLNENPKAFLNLSPFFMAVFACSFSIAMGTLWEVFEFGMDLFFGLNMQKSGLMDTMSDIIVVCIGAVIVSIYGYIYMRFNKSSIASRWLSNFIKGNPKIFSGKHHRKEKHEQE